MKRRISINSGCTVPQSFITKGKQRLKQYTNSVYLNNGDEFEIELFNPKQFKVLAKISLNGKSMGSGIILRPGERVFLERYLDDAKKFKFDTYFVSDSGETAKAIENNGNVVIEYYDEYIRPIYTNGTSTVTVYPSTLTWTNDNYRSPFTYTTNTTQLNNNFFTTTSLTSNTINSSNSTLTSSTNLPFQKDYVIPSTNDKVETGRVEKGSNSDQSFEYDSTTFNTYSSHKDTWKLLPQSTKMITCEDLVVYCTECGSKRKKDTFKFCPHCGTKF